MTRDAGMKIKEPMRLRELRIFAAASKKVGRLMY